MTSLRFAPTVGNISAKDCLCASRRVPCHNCGSHCDDKSMICSQRRNQSAKDCLQSYNSWNSSDDICIYCLLPLQIQSPSSNQPTQCHEARRGKCQMEGDCIVNRSYATYAHVWVPYIPLIQIHIYHIHILHSSSSKSKTRTATNRRNAMRRAEARAKWGALRFEIRKISDTLLQSQPVVSSMKRYLIADLMQIREKEFPGWSFQQLPQCRAGLHERSGKSDSAKSICYCRNTLSPRRKCETGTPAKLQGEPEQFIATVHVWLPCLLPDEYHGLRQKILFIHSSVNRTHFCLCEKSKVLERSADLQAYMDEV